MVRKSFSDRNFDQAGLDLTLDNRRHMPRPDRDSGRDQDMSGDARNARLVWDQIWAFERAWPRAMTGRTSEPKVPHLKLNKVRKTIKG